VWEKEGFLSVSTTEKVFNRKRIPWPLHIDQLKPVGALTCPKAAQAIPEGRQACWSTRQCPWLLLTAAVLIFWRYSSNFVYHSSAILKK